MKSGVSEILSYLFIGRYQDSLDEDRLAARGISHVLNVMESARFYGASRLTRLHMPLLDFGESSLENLLDRCCEFIEDARKADGKVLVHCSRGQNRSPTLVTAYLMKCCSMNLKQAFNLVRTKRPQFAPHEIYLSQLQDLEKSLYGSISLTEGQEPISIQEITRRITRESDDGN